MIMERGARPDAPPNPKRGKTAWIAMVALGVGLALGLGFGVGLGGDFALVGAFGTKRVLAAIASSREVSPQDRWRCNSVSEYDDVPTNEELEWIAVRWRARYAEPKWGTP
jgi:hypothetical protein